jgi:hypothetical protein
MLADNRNADGKDHTKMTSCFCRLFFLYKRWPIRAKEKLFPFNSIISRYKIINISRLYIHINQIAWF